MNNWNRELYELEQQIKAIKEKCDINLKHAPEGTLRISAKKQGFDCYVKKNEEGSPINGLYLKKENWNLARDIAQRDYDRKVLKKCNQILERIQNSVVDEYVLELTNIYEKMNVHRRSLIEPHILSDNEYCKRWLAVEYEHKGFLNDKEIITEKGERVRSKSEKIIADKLYFEGIPYRYEYPLHMNGYGTIYPDFMVMNRRTRREYYWEHLGMMDDMNYVEKTMLKLDLYERNGYIPGKNLIITRETQASYLNANTLNNIIETFLI